jgi:hypothetical protein
MVALQLLVGAQLFFYFLRGETGVRESALRAFVVWGALVFVVTETLSLGHYLNTPLLPSVWAAVTLLLIAYHKLTESEYDYNRVAARLGSLDRLSALLFTAVLGLTLIVALAAPPNNWDSMTYHMARVANWAQHGDIGHYPTHIVRQLMLSPWAEYAILNFQMLSGGSDRFANMVQWISFAMCAVAASLIIRRLDGRREIQILGALFVLTAPMLILQSTSTQNDLVVSAWLAAFVFFLFDDESEWILPGLCFGLAMNTKGTAITIAPVFLLAAWIFRGRSRGWKPVTVRVLKIGILALVLNAPYMWRNMQTFGHPSGDAGVVQRVNMQVHDPLHVASNVVRNLSIHMGAPIGRVTWAVETAVKRAHEIAGVDANDKRTSYTAFHVLSTSNHEDDAGNPIQFWLIIAGVIALIVKRKEFRSANIFSATLGVSFLFFCFLLKYQVWASRFQVPFFVLGAVVGALGMSALFRSDRALRRLGVFLVIAAIPWLLLNRTRPLVSVAWNPSVPAPAPGTLRSMLVNWMPAKSVLTADRDSVRYVNRPALRGSYRTAMDRAVAGGCPYVGLITTEDSWEYPLHVLARDQRDKVWFRHVDVTNSSRSIVRETRPVCAVVVLDSVLVNPPVLPGFQYRRDWQDSVIQVYRSQ